MGLGNLRVCILQFDAAPFWENPKLNSADMKKYVFQKQLITTWKTVLTSEVIREMNIKTEQNFSLSSWKTSLNINAHH